MAPVGIFVCVHELLPSYNFHFGVHKVWMKINVFSSGLLVGLVGLCGVELHYTPPSAWITLGVLLAAGLTLALLNLYFQVISAVLYTG